MERAAEHGERLGRGLRGVALNEIPGWFPVVLLAVLGGIIGSFLNVVVHRVPLGQSVVTPPSACPTCGHRIRPRDNVPVVSWLLLRGRCRDCGTAISVRYPLVELGTALVFAGVALRFADRPWALPAFAYLGGVAVALALIDLATSRLPDAIVLPSYLVMAALLVVASVAEDDVGALARAGAGAGALLVVYGLPWLVMPGGMGFGDVKLSGLLGLALGWLGWGPLVVGGFAAFLAGGLFALGLLVLRRGDRKTRVPFGPWMLLGAAIGVAVGDAVWAGYLALLV